MKKDTHLIEMQNKWGVEIRAGSPLALALLDNFPAQKQLIDVIDLLKVAWDKNKKTKWRVKK